jgi:hypothetical protein
VILKRKINPLPTARKNLKEVVIMEKKMTNLVAINYVLANCEVPAEVREKLAGMAAQLEKHNATRKSKNVMASADTDRIRSIVIDFLAGVESPVTMTEIFEQAPGLKETTTFHKLTYRVSKMADMGEVNRETVKRKTYFSAVKN